MENPAPLTVDDADSVVNAPVPAEVLPIVTPLSVCVHIGVVPSVVRMKPLLLS